jgi:phage host-nuclease inhibitor protein Gam
MNSREQLFQSFDEARNKQSAIEMEMNKKIALIKSEYEPKLKVIKQAIDIIQKEIDKL